MLRGGILSLVCPFFFCCPPYFSLHISPPSPCFFTLAFFSWIFFSSLLSIISYWWPALDKPEAPRAISLNQKYDGTILAISFFTDAQLRSPDSTKFFKELKTGHFYKKWMKGFTTWKKRIEINFMPVTVSQWNQFCWMICKTFASTNSHLFALLCYFGLQQSRNLGLEFCNSDESLNYKLPTFGDFKSKIKSWCP